MKTKLNNYVVIDCETGGLDRKNQEHSRVVPMTEIAAIGVSADNFQELHRYVSKVKGQYVGEDYVGYSPELVYQPEALKFTGVTIQQLEKVGVEIKEVVENLITVFVKSKTGSHLHKPIIVGHNVTYDIPFVQKIFTLTKNDLSKYLSGWKDDNGVFHPHFIDTMWLSRQKWNNEGIKHNLTALCDRLGVDLFDAHGALSDTVATLECFKKLTSCLRSEGGVSVRDSGVRVRESFQF